TMLIDQAKYFNFYVDSVDQAQQNVNVLDEAMRRASWSLRDVADSYLAALMEDAVPAGNTIGSAAEPAVPTSTDAYEHLVDLVVLLDEANTPTPGRHHGGLGSRVARPVMDGRLCTSRRSRRSAGRTEHADGRPIRRRAGVVPRPASERRPLCQQRDFSRGQYSRERKRRRGGRFH